MTNVNYAESVGPEVPDDGEQVLYFLSGECCRGFIHYDYLCVNGKGLGNLHGLLLSHGQLAAAGIDINVDSDLTE